MAKTKKPPFIPRIPLGDLGDRYIHHLEIAGVAVDTVRAYAIELDTAYRELGVETPIADLAPADIERFNECKRVTRLSSGRRRGKRAVEKTRRVLKLALDFAVHMGLLRTSPAKDAPAQEHAPAQGITQEPAYLEVPQAEAEAAAQEAEAQVANGQRAGATAPRQDGSPAQ
jgi:hypothetical protein